MGDSTPAPPDASAADPQPPPMTNPATNGDTPASAAKLTSDTLQPGDVITEQFLMRLAKLEKYEHKLAEVARVYRNLNTARKAIEGVLKKLTPIQSIADVDELEAHLSNLNMKSQYAGEQIGALTELDKANRAKINDLESKLSGLQGADDERQRLAKELDQITKERKVVEGQLERSNQKLKLDIEALKSKQAELETQDHSTDTLAEKLSAMLGNTTDDLAANENLNALRALLVEKCGVPEGLVNASEADAAKKRGDEVSAQLKESKQTQESLELDLAKTKEQLYKATEEKDKAIGDINATLLARDDTIQQAEAKAKELADQIDLLKSEHNTTAKTLEDLSQKLEAESKAKREAEEQTTELSNKIAALEAKAADAPSSSPPVNTVPATADILTIERVESIISAAFAHNLVTKESHTVVTDQSPQTQPQQHQGGGGGKKKGKGKRKASKSVSTPSAPPAAEISEAPVPVMVTKEEVDRLISLVESAGAGSVKTKDDSPAKPEVVRDDAKLAELQKTIDELSSQLDEARKAAADASDANTAQIESLQAEVDRLKESLQAAEAERDSLQQQLAAKESEMRESVSTLEKQLADAEQQAQTTTDKQTSKINELETALKDAQTNMDTLSKKHAAESESQAKDAEVITSKLAAAEKLASEVPSLKEKCDAARATATKLEGELREQKVKLDETEAALTKANSNFKDERARLATSLAKAQGNGARLEGQQQELQAKLTKASSECAQEKQRADSAESSLEQARATVTKAREDATATARQLADKDRQIAEIQGKLAELEEHVRTVDDDLANSRELFSEKSRVLAQATSQLQESQYALEKAKRANKAAAEDAAKELEGVRVALAEARQQAKDQASKDHAEIGKLRAQLGTFDQQAKQASQVERLEAEQAERMAELETLRSNLQRSDEQQAALQVEVDRLRDIEKDLKSSKDQLERVTDERKLSEQRWKRVHRDLKEEVRRLHRERQLLVAQPSPGASNSTSPMPPTSPQKQNLNVSSSSPGSRSNSLTMASVSSLLRAATGNAAASGNSALPGIPRRASAQTASPTVAPQDPRKIISPHWDVEAPAHSLRQEQPFTAESAPPPNMANHRLEPNAKRDAHVRSASTAGSSSNYSEDSQNESTVNTEYLRNVLFRFFNDKDRRSQLVPVLSMLLNCSTEDIKHIQSLLLK
ncbi:Golgin imh1 [Linderina macrospora]|uniref:Golgin imh1 n=1 Tax=Linderina macrospora TaxID=4868 RepID=A0ACC1JEP6_9FUNG|nr:Golgin imh1 [Linderina macrospora]